MLLKTQLMVQQLLSLSSDSLRKTDHTKGLEGNLYLLPIRIIVLILERIFVFFLSTTLLSQCSIFIEIWNISSHFCSILEVLNSSCILCQKWFPL